MKVKNISLKKGILIIYTVSNLILLSGCSSTSSKNNGKTPNESEKVTEIEENNQDSRSQEENIDITEPIEDIKTGDNFNSEDEVINYFDELKNKVSNYLSKGNIEKCKDNVYNILLTSVGFITNQESIRGVYFSDLTDETKQVIISASDYIDEKIESKFPTYKEDIKQFSGKSYDVIKEKYNKIKETVKGKLEEKLGPEKYDEYYSKYEKAKEKTKEIVTDGYNHGKTKVKEKWNDLKKWYQEKK